MGLFDKVFGSKSPGMDNEQQALQTLTEIRNEVTADPKKAEKLLLTAGKKHFVLFSIGKPLHQEYRKAYEDVLARLMPEQTVGDWPLVKNVCWDTWDYPTVGCIAETVADTEAEVVHLFAPEKRQIKNALAELNALYALVQDDSVVMAVAGEEDTFVKKDFAIQAAQAVDPDSEEVLQDWQDYADSQGMKTELVVA